jgi:hypothetical protein
MAGASAGETPSAGIGEIAIMPFSLMMSPGNGYAAAVLIVLGLPWGGLSPARQPDTEADLLARIQHEQDPVKKAKYEVRLGRVKLLQAIDAYGKGNLEQGQQLLDDYLGRIKDSWQLLQSSGRRAVRHPQGFKELDIELREDARMLEDLKHRVSYTDREPVEKAAQEVERIRAEVLRALFPAEKPAADGDRLAAPADLVT